MFNTILWVIMALFEMTALVLAFRYFGKLGIIGFMSGSIVLMNILASKSIMLFGFGATSAVVVYAVVFLATDMLSEHFGGKEARKAVMLGFMVSVITMVAAYLAVSVAPAPWDMGSEALASIFTPMFRVVLGSMTAYLVSNNLDTITYEWLRKKFPKMLWLRNNGSTWTSQFLDTVIFFAIAFGGVFPFSALVSMTIGGYVLKVIVAAMDTPFLYWSKKMAEKHPEILEK